MVDILSIGSGAVNAYRQALATSSNNIANVNTPGYSKRALQIGESFPVQEGAFSFGAGAQSDAIVRAYDEFIEKSLRDALGDLSVNEPVIQHANRIIDLMGNDSGSLSNAIDDFFNSADLLSAQPTSLVHRDEFLNSAEVVADRFNDISLQIESISRAAELEFSDAVDEMNSLAEQLLVVNRQLNRKTSVDQQPPGLLDQRDAILRDMAALSKIGVSESLSGQVTVNFGGPGRGFEFITPNSVTKIGIFSNNEKSAVDMRLVLDPFGVRRPLPNNPGGTLGGYLALNTEVLRPARVGMDHLAASFAHEVNAVHQLGQDQDGFSGGPLFDVKTTFTTSFETSNGKLSASLIATDYVDVEAEPIELIYRERVDAWDVINTVTRDRIATLPVEGGTSGGLKFSIAGDPENGDVITFTPEYRPAQSIAALISDPRKVAVAATMQSRPHDGNSLSIDTDLTFRPSESPRQPVFERGFFLESPDSVASRQDLNLTAGGRGPSLQLLRDSTGVNVEFGIEYDANQHLHVFTSEGVHLAGTNTLTLAEANALISSDEGFGQGAYSSSYLNKNGSEAFLDTSILFGVLAVTRTESVESIDPETGALIDGTRIDAPAVVSKPIVPTENGESQATTIIDSGDLVFEYAYLDPSDVDADEDGEVKKSFALDALEIDPSSQLSARAIAQYFESQFEANSLGDFSASALTRVIASDVDPERSLSINGEEIILSPAMGLAQIIGAINDQSHLTNVRAEWIGDDGIALVNTSGFEGENIVLGAPALVDQRSALGQVPGIYAGTYEIQVTGTDPSTNRPSIESFVLKLSDQGQPSDLGRIGLNTELIIDGKVPADLAVFVTGSGDLDASIRAVPEAQQQVEKMPARPFSVSFISDSIYTITDIETDTVVTTRLYDEYQGIQYQDVTLEFSSNPQSGDVFFVEKNVSGTGSNENLLRLIELGKEPIIQGQTFSEAYRDLVAGAGSRSRLAQLNEDAMQVIKDQAEASREAAVGVNLDEEASDLIRFQQAYQAAAQVIQISQRMFDTLIQAR